MLYLDSHFPPDPGSVPEARHRLGGLEEFLDAARMERAQLLVSELMANSVRHAGLGPDDWIWLRVTLLERSLRVEVSDAGPGIAGVRPGPRADGGGWGLHFLERTADRWGHEQDDVSCVWFELDLRN